MNTNLLSRKITPDAEAFMDCINRKCTPKRVHYCELFLDTEIEDQLCSLYGLLDGISPDDPLFGVKRNVAVQRFMGYDYVRHGLDEFRFPLNWLPIEDTADMKHEGGRTYMDEHKGPITNWEEFEKYPWPDPKKASLAGLEYLQKNLPDDMCIIGSGGFGHFCELLSWLLGYETLCYALYDERDLVKAISDRLIQTYIEAIKLFLQFDRVKVTWGSDDMGFRSGTLISPDDLREFVLPGHKLMAEMSHAAGRPYFLHSCGNLESIMPDLLDDVKIDARHSFEDTIDTVIDVKKQHGDRLTILGGIDVDFLCRADEQQLRKRVKETLEACHPGGGFCLGSGNSVTNYVPIENYLIMMDEGRNFVP